MEGTTSEVAVSCSCQERELPLLVAAWRTRHQPVIARLVNEGRTVNADAAQVSARLVVGIKNGDAEAFAEGNRLYGHHLEACPYACPPDQVGLVLLSRA